MTVNLPDLPRLAKVRPKVIRFGADLTPSLGGPTQRILRLGARFSIEITLPTVKLGCARTWLAARQKAEAEGETLRIKFPQIGDASAVTGKTADVGGGASLTVNDGSGIVAGMFFSFIAAGHAYLHQVTSVAGDELTVAPLLRAVPDGLALEFAEPVVEGYADEVAWDLEYLRLVGMTFTLTEDR